VHRAREKLKTLDREKIGDQQIGELLAHAPSDAGDDVWPHRAVRRVIEDVASHALEVGIEMGRINQRGVFSKSAYEGGAQERDLATKAATAAAAVAAWPRTAQLLKRISENWTRQAVSEDHRMEQRKARDD